MAYQYGAPPGAYGGRPQGYGSYGAPPTPGAAAPGMAPPPGMDAPLGMGAQMPPGQAGFQPPPSIAGLNFNAPVIRLGLDQKPATPADRITGGRGGGDGGRGSNSEPLGGNRDRRGLGADAGNRNMERERAAIRENMMAVQPPTREEVARTIFVGGITDDAPSDDAIESILRCAGKLRRWTRARDADDNKCKFGFAEFEDVDSLEAANDMFGQGIEVPAYRGAQIKKADDGSVKRVKLLVVVDEQSQKYIEEWIGKRNEDEDGRQFRLDTCKEDLQRCMAEMSNADAFTANAALQGNGDGDAHMADADGKADAEAVTIPLAQNEDDLADIPEEMRATVAAEIKAFRDRSTRRDLERLKREEEMEQQERQRSLSSRLNRMSPPPNGLAGSSNGVPLGPRDRTGGPAGAPSGPKGFRGAQMPSDYANGVSFVGANGTNGISLNREDEDASESDEELEARRRKKREEELEKQYLDQERRWLNRERVSGTAHQREREHDARAAEEKRRQKEALAKRFRDWNDDEEVRLGREEYYVDRSAWLRKRGAYRDAEARQDELDRSAEERKNAARGAQQADARDQADAFLDQMGQKLAANASKPTPAEPFKISLGGAALRNKAPAPAPAADAEGLLEDEEDAAASGRKPELKPLSDTSTLPTNGADLTPEERTAARQQLAAEIPTATDALFAYKVRWTALSTDALQSQIRPMVEKKVVEYLGVQEELLVDLVVDGIKERRRPEELVTELEPALEEEASVLVKKAWRLVVFLSESAGRGLN